jgi:HSP20 family molecular chaperone IbpA
MNKNQIAHIMKTLGYSIPDYALYHNWVITKSEQGCEEDIHGRKDGDGITYEVHLPGYESGDLSCKYFNKYSDSILEVRADNKSQGLKIVTLYIPPELDIDRVKLKMKAGILYIRFPSNIKEKELKVEQ